MTTPDLPTGTVAFLFTDIEGSTRLWERDRVAMAAVVDRHNELLRAASAAHRGVLFKTIGDAIQAAFFSPVEAVAAAVDGQRALAAEAWEETGAIRARMAVHVGEATPAGGDYTAYCLNRLARLLATGHGGQVLLTDEVRRAVEGDLPVGATLRSLGVHHLRDLLEPEPVSQLVIAGLPDTFPPLNSLERHPHNLPIQLTELVGRDDELATLRDLLRGEARLITLTGPGGVGKTRLALQVAADALDAFDHGAFLVDLQAVREAALVIPAIAATLGVREAGGQALAESVATYLANRRLLLVLDNFEQVIEAAAEVGRLLAQAPGLKLLATSREVLRLRGEREVRLGPLAIPAESRKVPEVAVLARIPAVDLFVRRAVLARPSFALDETNAAAVAEICRRLDGLPLAIELAAARTKVFAPPALLQRLDNRLALLTAGARDLPERQQTLRAAIAWSHDLLTPAEQALFRRFSIFAGGARIAVAEAVCGESTVGGRQTTGETTAVDRRPSTVDSVVDGLTSLVDKSLLRQVDDADGEPRFTMLQTLRDFGLERLSEAGEIEAIERAHEAWCLALAEEAEPHLLGHDQTVWLGRLAADMDNVRTALAAAELRPAAYGLRLAGALRPFWQVRSLFTEGRRWLEDALRRDREPPGPARLKVLIGAGAMALGQGDSVGAAAWWQEGLAVARERGDIESAAKLLNNLGIVAMNRGEWDDADNLFGEALDLGRSLGDGGRTASTLGNLAAVAHFRGEYDRATTLYEECLALCRRMGNRQWQLSLLHNLRSLITPVLEERDRAETLGHECLRLANELGDRRGVAHAHAGLGTLADTHGEWEQAVERFEESLAVFREIGDRSGEARVLGNLGMVAADRGDRDRAATLCRDSLRLFVELEDPPGIAHALEGVAIALQAGGEWSRAAQLLGAADTIRRRLKAPIPRDLERRHERLVGALRENLDEAAFAAAWTVGRDLSQTDAVRLGFE